MAERVEALALLGISQRSRVQTQVEPSKKYGEFSSREKSHGFSPDYNAKSGEALDKFGH